MNDAIQKIRLKNLLTGKIKRGVFYIVSDLSERDVEEIVTTLETFKYEKIELVEFSRTSSLDLMIEELSIKYPSTDVNALSNLIFTANDNIKDRIQLRLLACIFSSMVGSGSVFFHLYFESEKIPLSHEEIKLIQKAIECSKNNILMVYLSKGGCNDLDNTINVLQLNSDFTMNKNKSNRLHKVHVSYKHDKEHDAVVSQLVIGFLKNKIEYSIDKDDIAYRDDIEAYEKEIGNSDKVVMFITDGYLKSLACMFEMACIFGNEDFVEKIYPIVHLKEIHRDYRGLTSIKEYWNTQKEERIEAIRNTGESEVIQKDLEKIKMLLDKLDALWKYIVDINTGDYNLLIANHADLLMRSLLESMNPVSSLCSGDFVPSGDTAPDIVRRVVNQGENSVYVENNTGTINIS